MEIDQKQFADVTVLVPAGRLDHKGSEPFKDAMMTALQSDGSGSVVVDLSGVDYVSSVGLRAIMIASKHARGGKGDLLVCALQPTVQEIFEISRFNHVVKIHDDLRGALASLSEQAAGAYDSA